MSGFTRDTYYYGDKLVYEALHAKWGRYHGTHCRCGQDWITAHGEPAGFTVVRSGNGFTALTGPGLTEHVDENALTANALWQAVTGKPGTQDWHEQVRVVDRSPEAQAAQKASSDAYYAKLRERSAAAKVEPATAKQIKYLEALAAKTNPERFDTEFAKAVKGTDISPRGEAETTGRAVRRLTRASAANSSPHSRATPEPHPSLSKLKLRIQNGQVPREKNRYTAGRLNTDLRHIVRNLIDHAPRPLDEPPIADPDLAALDALASIAHAVDSMIDRHIVSARRRERIRRDWTIKPGRPVPWNQIGQALGLTGQAVGKSARTHHLPITPLTPERLARLLDEGRRLGDELRGRRSPLNTTSKITEGDFES
ncbi:hypothetical protein [Nocardia farcinica]|uniref:hypothetical protein n=1 Tax=Nocardia farcinica TaxID=37329 RepID=UPI001B3C86ED|nr:hypothetical protein [Nocardia farcinica]